MWTEQASCVLVVAAVAALACPANGVPGCFVGQLGTLRGCCGQNRQHSRFRHVHRPNMLLDRVCASAPRWPGETGRPEELRLGRRRGPVPALVWRGWFVAREQGGELVGIHYYGVVIGAFGARDFGQYQIVVLNAASFCELQTLPSMHARSARQQCPSLARCVTRSAPQRASTAAR